MKTTPGLTQLSRETAGFRNVDASRLDPVEDWPTEALDSALSRGALDDWARINAAIRRQPWGRVARTIESLLGYSRSYGVDLLMERAIVRARDSADARDRAEVAEDVRRLLAASGLSRTQVAALLGTSTSRLSTYTTGRVTPSAAVMVRLRRIATTPPFLDVEPRIRLAQGVTTMDLLDRDDQR